MKRSDSEVRTFTDLHTHILPAIDDGAADLETAQKMLRLEKAEGVARVALTPHFYPMEEELETFLNRRQQAYATLLSGWDGETMPAMQLGAEVRYTPQLADMDLRPLTIGGGDYLLLELSDTALPAHIEPVLDRILLQEITPLLAHVERCVYFLEEPELLLGLIRMGALAQISTKALTCRKSRRFAQACLKNGLAQVLASDLHNTTKNRPGLGSTFSVLDKALCARAEEFARAIWENKCPPAFAIHPVKKGLLGYS